MYRPLTLFIGLRYIFGKNKDNFGRFISWLSMIGLMLGALALIVVLSVMNGLEQQMQNSILRFLPQAIVTNDQEQIDPKIDKKILLTSLSGVYSISPLVTGNVILQSAKNLAVTQMMGISPYADEPMAPFMFFGSLHTLKPHEYGIVIGSTLAEQLQLNIGDHVRVIATNVSKITPIGRIPNQRVFVVQGVFSVNKDINQSLVFVNIDDAAKLIGLPGGYISGWRLILNDPLSIESLIQQPLPKDLHFNDWRAERGELFAAIKLEKKMMGLLISLIVIVAAFNIITSLSLVVMEKQGEVAILKTQGFTQTGLMRIFMLQGATAGIVGTLIGTLMGVFITHHLNALMNYFHVSIAGIVLPTRIDPLQVFIIVITLITVALLVTVYPAWYAAKTAPAEALRYE